MIKRHVGITMLIVCTVIGGIFNGAGASSARNEILPGVFIENFPPTTKNESCILNWTIWNMFESIDGFENIPTTIGELISADDAISILLTDTNNETYIINLSARAIENYEMFENNHTITYIKITTLKYRKLGVENTDETSECIDTVGGVSGAVHALTTYVDSNRTIHIFFLVTSNIEDASCYYYLFYSKVDTSRNVMDNCKIFYFEKRGSIGPLYYKPSEQEEKTFIPSATSVLTIAAITMVSAVLYRRYKSKMGVYEKVKKIGEEFL